MLVTLFHRRPTCISRILHLSAVPTGVFEAAEKVTSPFALGAFGIAAVAAIIVGLGGGKSGQGHFRDRRKYPLGISGTKGISGTDGSTPKSRRQMEAAVWQTR